MPEKGSGWLLFPFAGWPIVYGVSRFEGRDGENLLVLPIGFMVYVFTIVAVVVAGLPLFRSSPPGNPWATVALLILHTLILLVPFLWPGFLGGFLS